MPYVEMIIAINFSEVGEPVQPQIIILWVMDFIMLVLVFNDSANIANYLSSPWNFMSRLM